MACLEMYNSDQHKGPNHNHNQYQCAPPMSPRISFSNDFVDLQQAMKQERSSSSRSVSSDFEFSVSNHSMMSADELFFKGKFLPYKDNNNMQGNNRGTTTLREELLVDDGDDDDGDGDGFSLRPPKGSRWKGFLGLRKNHIASKKGEGSSSSGEARRRAALVNEGASINVTSSQGMLNEGGSSSSDLEIGL